MAVDIGLLVTTILLSFVNLLGFSFWGKQADGVFNVLLFDSLP